MNYAIEQLKNKVSLLMEEGEISLLFNMVREDIANQILHTQPSETEKREELYMQAQGVLLLERKMAGIANDVFKENN